MEVLSLIPARSGSKSIKDKNLRLINNKQLIAYSIEHARQSDLINRVVVSTDSEDYAEIARSWGAETPFIRPPELATDSSTDFGVFEHALNYLKSEENYIPDICVHLRPTYPVRSISDINNCIRIISERKEFDSVRSISIATETPFKMWTLNKTGTIVPVLSHQSIKESHSVPRQLLPDIYLQNACIDVIRTSTITEKKSMVGDHVYGYIMNENLDIDNETQLRLAAEYINYNGIQKQTGKTFCFDIDGVIASLTTNNDYNLAGPLLENIKLINKLHHSGHQIILNSARGNLTGIDWKVETEKQLREWGVKYHQLILGSKPAADFYIDDKSIDINQLRTIIFDDKNESQQ